MQHATTPVKVSTIFAGKLRRYHGESFLEKLLDIPTIFHNTFDMLLVVLGFFQSFFKLLLWRPRVVFLKGGFVCLPVGYAAHLLRIPIVIHDSDTHPGLTNRLIAPFATAIATGAPLKYYNYPAQKAVYTGIPISTEFSRINSRDKTKLKEELGLSTDKPVVLVTGGGLGAKRINDTMVSIGSRLIEHAAVVHLSGVKQYSELEQTVPQSDSYTLTAFIDSSDMARYLKVADVVVARSGASFMAELAAVGVSAIIIPNAQLVGGHQLKNAQMYADEKAALIVNEKDMSNRPEILLDQILSLLENTKARQNLGTNLYNFAKPDAATAVAKLIEKAAG